MSDLNSNNLRAIPSCTRCRNHGIINVLKKHKRFCSFQQCKCDKCNITLQRQRIMSIQMAMRRNETKKDYYYITHKKLTTVNKHVGVTEPKADTVDNSYEKKYGKMPLIMSKFTKKTKVFTRISELNKEMEGTVVWVRTRLHTSKIVEKQCFIVLRQQQNTVVAMIFCESNKMLKFISDISVESLIEVEAVVRTLRITSNVCTQSDVELDVKQIWLVQAAAPLQIKNSVLELRSTANQTIFKLRAEVYRLFRHCLTEKGFVESPHIFEVESHQFSNQMAITADFERVFICTTFGNLYLEMAFYNHYHEVMFTIAYMFTEIFTRLQDLKYNKEVFMFLKRPLVLHFGEAREMLKIVGVEIGEKEELQSDAKILLGHLVKEKYGTDFYVLDKFPLIVRPFDTMPDPEDPIASNSYDMFMRGELVLSGGQRIHDLEMLAERARHNNIDIDKIAVYIESFKYACPPHAGAKIDIERVVTSYLNLDDDFKKTST